MRDHLDQYSHPEKGAGNRPSPSSARNKENVPVRHLGNRQNQRAQTPGEKKHDDHASCPDKSVFTAVSDQWYFTP